MRVEIFLIDQATAAFFRFLRHPSRPNAPRPVKKLYPSVSKFTHGESDAVLY